MSFGSPVRNGLAVGLLASTFLSSRRAAYPAMFLNFLQPYLDTRVTFTRGSNATLVDSTGKITYAPANLLLRSEEFDTAAWIKDAATFTANATTAPDGTSTADKFVATATIAFHGFYQSITGTVASYTYSVYAKAAEYSKLQLANGGAGTWSATFDLATGATIATGGTAVLSSSIQSVGNGWYRCAVTFTGAAVLTSHSAAGYPNTGATLNNFGASYTGDGTSGIFIWGAQLEPVTYQTTPSTYVATTSAAYTGPRFDYDPVTLAPKGLLIEEARTNLLLQSQDWNTAAWSKPSITVTNNSITAPDGTLTGNKLLTSGATTITQAISSTATSQTFSVYVKLGSAATAANKFLVRNVATAVNLLGVELNYATGDIIYSVGSSGASVVAVGNGWWRLTLSVTSGITIGNTLIVYTGFTGGGANGDFLYAWGAQLEAGSFATSYIPTVASQVTRSADVATMTGTNFSSWYNQTEGTFVASADTLKPPSVATANFIAIASDGTQNERVQNVIDTSNVTAGVIDGNVSQANFTNAYTLNQVINSAIAYKVNDFAASFNGSAATTDTSGTIPTVNRMTLGSSWDGLNFFLNGHIRSIAYYNTRLPNSQLQALTAPSLAITLNLDFINGTYDA